MQACGSPRAPFFAVGCAWAVACGERLGACAEPVGSRCRPADDADRWAVRPRQGREMRSDAAAARVAEMQGGHSATKLQACISTAEGSAILQAAGRLAMEPDAQQEGACPPGEQQWSRLSSQSSSILAELVSGGRVQAAVRQLPAACRGSGRRPLLFASSQSHGLRCLAIADAVPVHAAQPLPLAERLPACRLLLPPAHSCPSAPSFLPRLSRPSSSPLVLPPALGQPTLPP